VTINHETHQTPTRFFFFRLLEREQRRLALGALLDGRMTGCSTTFSEQPGLQIPAASRPSTSRKSSQFAPVTQERLDAYELGTKLTFLDDRMHVKRPAASTTTTRTSSC